MIDSSPWANQPHRGRKTVPLRLSTDQRQHCELLLRNGTTEQRVARRAQALLFFADAVTAKVIAQILGYDKRSVFKLKARAVAAPDPLTVLADAHRTGRPISLFRRLTAHA